MSNGKVVSFINMKGGVGKTTLAVNISYTLSQVFGKKVLLIDIDPQMNATQSILDAVKVKELLEENHRNTIYGILSKENKLPTVSKSSVKSKFDGIINVKSNFDFIPSHLEIMNLNLGDLSNRLKSFIKTNKLTEKYHVIIIDSPPTISHYTKISLLASDFYVVPMKTDYLSFFGLPLLEYYVEQLNEDYSENLELLGIILNMVQPDYKIYEEIKDKLNERNEWKTKLFTNELKNRTSVARALSPDNRDTLSQYIIESSDQELKDEMIAIAQEFIQKGRI